jgi:hypothetical protein
MTWYLWHWQVSCLLGVLLAGVSSPLLPPLDLDGVTEGLGLIGNT